MAFILLQTKNETEQKNRDMESRKEDMKMHQEKMQMQWQMMNMIMMSMMVGQTNQADRHPDFWMPDPLPEKGEEDNYRKPAAKENSKYDDVLKGSDY